MAFTLSKCQSNDIKHVVKNVLQRHALADACEDIYLVPDVNYDGDNVLRIVISVNEVDTKQNGHQSDAIMELLSVLSPYLLNSPNNAFPLPHIVPTSDSPILISEMINAAAV